MPTRSFRKSRFALFVDAAFLALVGAGAVFDLSRRFDWMALVYALLLGVAGTSLAFAIARPDLLYKSGSLGFRPWTPGRAWPWRWTRIPVGRIASVREGVRPVRGLKQSVPKPTFLFRTADGRELEYFPDEHPGPVVDRIRSFLSRVPGLPPLVRAEGG